MKTLLMTMALFGGAGFQTSAIAQGTPASQLPACKLRLDDIRTSTPDERLIRISEALRFEQNATCFAQLLLQSADAQRAAFMRFFKDLEARRTDKQAGSSVGTGGTSSLVSKGLAAHAIGLATEYGALTESVNKGVLTVSGSLDGFAAALARKNLIEYCPDGKNTLPLFGVQQSPCLNRGGLDFLRRISYGVSFDTGQNSENVSGMPSGAPQGTAQPVTFTANRHQISAVKGRFVVWNARDDATSKEFGKKWTTVLQTSADADAVKAAGQQLSTAFKAFADLKLNKDAYNKALGATIEEFRVAGAADLDEKFNNWANQFIKLANDSPGLIDAVVNFLQARQAYLLAEDQLVSSLADKPVLTFEYNDNRKVGQDPTSTFRAIFDKGLGNNWSLTANGAFTVFDTHPKVAGVGRLRDAQFGIQAQRDLGSIAFLGAAALSGAYYFQYQASPAILNVTPGMPLPGISFTGLPSTATQVFADKGNLHVGQIKLVMGPGTSSVRFPVAVTYSNRTELIAKPSWRAQIGISYDFDSLFAK